MDPMIALEYSNVPYNTWKLDENPMSGIQLKLKQTIPFPGKNSKRKAVVESEGLIKSWELAELKLQLKDKVEKAYYQLGLNRELKAISLKHIALLEDLIETMYNKYEVGKSAQSDILRMTLMKEKLLDDLEDFEQKESEIQATINSVLNRDVNTSISTEMLTNNLDLDLNLDTLLNSAIQNRPLLKKIEETSKMKRLSFQSAQSERMPDLTLWTGYRIRQDVGMMENVDFASVGFSFPIPLDMKGKIKAKMNSAKFKEKAVDENYNNVLNKISEMLLMANSGLERQTNKINNYTENLIPNAEKVFSSELKSYETGRANFADLYQAQLQLIQFEKILLKAKYKYKMYEITIETLIGEKL
ncbi:MAG: hypothetical protein DRI23_11830 [Candidatus Cloacimonadota bacterium]|nr:MAG: hypothetical protein DRI23_11830 [Candidatus Cloacimonadota bacterium]